MSKPACPRCGSKKLASAKRGAWRCTKCSAEFSTDAEGIFASHSCPVRSAMNSERKPDMPRSH